jgi:hypothetical protein
LYSKVLIIRTLAVALGTGLLALGACATDGGTEALPLEPGPGEGVFLIVSDLHFDPFADPAIVKELAAADVHAWPAIFKGSKGGGSRRTAATPTIR